MVSADGNGKLDEETAAEGIGKRFGNGTSGDWSRGPLTQTALTVKTNPPATAFVAVTLSLTA